jgi:peptidoglycan/xylan/chitin deacetylase (PgdA/CDA1 family)
VEKLYITYETIGDRVEAEDINNVQNEIVRTQGEINSYEQSNDTRAANAETRIKTIEDNKYDKNQTFTREEVIQKINDLINGAPGTLDTLNEIETALGNDPNFATTIINLLGNKVDKETGKSLLANTEIERLLTLNNYDDTNVKNLISNNAHAIQDVNLPSIYDKSIISIIDDDGKKEFLTRTKPVYDEKGIKTTLGIITDLVGTDGYMTLSELQNLYNSGYELASHSQTHSATYFNSDLAITPNSTFEIEFSKSKQWFKDNGLGIVETIVYPYANFGNDKIRIKNIAKKYYKLGINADGDYNVSPNDPIYLNRYFIDISTFTLTQIEETIDKAIAAKAWLILGVHSWNTSQNTPEALGQIIDYIKSKNVDIMTIQKALEYKANIISIGEYTDEQKGFFIGRDGAVINKSEKTRIITTDFTVTTDSNISSFKDGKFSIVQITKDNDKLTNTGGLMYIYRNTYYSYCIFISNYGKKVFTKMWDESNSKWLDWNDITSQTLNIIQGTYTGTMNDDITKYPKYKETIVQIPQANDTLTNTGGVMRVYRGDTYYSYALFYPIGKNL